MSKLKRYVISTSETFVASFLATFLLQIEQILNQGVLPTKQLLIAAFLSGIIAGTKIIIKSIRESW